ncbi:MAG: bifunctional homocysteine S-methyltransferase/methylenetetrahydrofolate reductase, partial [Bryobacteraceae bacterium]
MPVTATPTRVAEFREALAQRVVVADGAMGTMLYSKGAFINRCCDELNLSLPALVRDVHQEYVRAGAELIETNTFGANRKRLAPFGFADKVRLINRAGVRIAREAARDQAFVAAAIGPLGVRLEPLGSTTIDEARSIFREQIEALVEAGVDCLMLETFRDLNEVRAAVEAAREAAGPEMVVMVHLSIEDDGLLQDGTSIEDFTRALDAMPIDVIGLNCSSGPSVMLDTLEQMRAYTNKPLSALPNAGLGKNVFSPEYMASCAARFVEAGASIVGGCCGTTQEHIKGIREAVLGAQPVRRSAVISSLDPDPQAKPQPMETLPVAAKSDLGAKLAAGTFVSLVEILPPRGLDGSQEIATAKLYREAGFDCVIVSDRPRAGAHLSAQVACQLIRQEAGVEAALHVHERDRNFLRIQNKLLSAYKVGIRNLICMTGDGVASVAGRLNQGLDLSGNRFGSQTGLLLGVEVNPSATDMDDELRRFESRVKAGAEFAVTQPIFHLGSLEVFLKFGIPVIAGIRPLTSLRNAEFMVNELRVPVPEPYMERMRNANNAEAARAEGVAIAREMVQKVRPLAAGVQLSAPLGRYQT